MQGIADCLAAIAAAQQTGVAQRAVSTILPLEEAAVLTSGPIRQLNEAEGRPLCARSVYRFPSARWEHEMRSAR